MYLSWNEKTITDFSDENIESAYNDGYVSTRVGKGVMKQTRSLRIDLSKFELSSENKRILKKTEELILNICPIPYEKYTWEIHKLGKDFYEQKFGKGTFSAQKIKELITDTEESNFNQVFVYSLNNADVGYCIALETKNILHYCYPFYNLELSYPNIGLGMMTKAIVWAKENKLKSAALQGTIARHDFAKSYIYLGSFSRPTDTYKLQFSGLEWFDGQNWQTDLNELKKEI